MERYYLILRDNWVVNRFVNDGEFDWESPHELGYIMEDVEGFVNIGDWYEESENVFYRPLSIPPDYPQELI